MQNVPLDSYPKTNIVDTRGVSPDADSDVQQLPGRNYDPSYGMDVQRTVAIALG